MERAQPPSWAEPTDAAATIRRRGRARGLQQAQMSAIAPCTNQVAAKKKAKIGIGPRGGSTLPAARLRPRGRALLSAPSGTPALTFWLGRGASLGPADGSHLPAASASAEEPIAAIGLEPRHAHAGRHLELFQDLSRSRVDPPHVALVAFPSAVPELAVDPGDAGNEAVGFDGAKNAPVSGSI